LPPPIDVSGWRLTAAESKGTVCELSGELLTLVKVVVSPMSVLKKEKVLAFASTGNRGKRSIPNDAPPIKRLKNKDFLSFFAKNRLTIEETPVL